MRQLTEDEVDLEEKLQQLYALDSLLQERSNNVTLLQDDNVRLFVSYYYLFCITFAI